MSAITAFDPNGPIGPALTLVYRASYFSDKGVSELITLIIKNCNKRGIEPQEGKELFDWIRAKNLSDSTITPTEMFASPFFQSMRKKELAPSIYRTALIEQVVPPTFKSILEHFPHASLAGKEGQMLSEWLSVLMESSMTEEQIQSLCNQPDQAAIKAEQVNKERSAIGLQLYGAVVNKKQISERDLDGIIKINRFAIQQLEELDHPGEALCFTGQYLKLFSMSESPSKFSADVLGLLSTVFRDKVFPKTIASSTTRRSPQVEESKQ